MKHRKREFQWIIYNQEKKIDEEQLSPHCLPVPTKEIVGVNIERQCSMTVYLL